MGHPPEPIASAYSLDTEAASARPSPKLSQETLHEHEQLKTWRSAIWDTWELPKDQRWLMFKLDAFVLTFASVSKLPLLIQSLLILISAIYSLDTSSRTWIKQM